MLRGVVDVLVEIDRAMLAAPLLGLFADGVDVIGRTDGTGQKKSGGEQGSQRDPGEGEEVSFQDE